MHEELEHLKHVGSRIIEERVHTYKLENAKLRAMLKDQGVELSPSHHSSESEKITQSEEARLKQYLAEKEKQIQEQFKSPQVVGFD